MTAHQSEDSLSSAQKQFVDYLQSKGKAHSTLLAYGKDVDQFVEFCQQQAVTSVSQVDTSTIEAFKTKLTQDNYTAKSVSRKINSIKSFFRFLKGLGVIQENPATQVAHPKVEISPPRILSKLEYRALRDACRHDERISAIVEILLQTGLRISEIAKIRVEDVNKEFNKIKVNSTQAHENRVVPLNKSASKALENYLHFRPQTQTPNLFVTKTGRPFLVRNIRTAIDRYFKLAEVKKAKVNDLRHTFIAEQLTAGTPLTYVSKLVGHKRITTTEKYLKYLDSRDQKSEIKLQEL